MGHILLPFYLLYFDSQQGRSLYFVPPLIGKKAMFGDNHDLEREEHEFEREKSFKPTKLHTEIWSCLPSPNYLRCRNNLIITLCFYHYRIGCYLFCSGNSLMSTKLRGCGLQARTRAVYNLCHLRAAWHYDLWLGFFVGCLISLLFVCLFVFESGFLCVVALAVLELTL